MKGSDQVKRIPVIFLRYIVFFIPAIILSVLVWNHYQDDLSAGKRRNMTSNKYLHSMKENEW